MYYMEVRKNEKALRFNRSLAEAAKIKGKVSGILESETNSQLVVNGQAMKIHRNNEFAAKLESSLLPCASNHAVLIDRFDARAMMDAVIEPSVNSNFKEDTLLQTALNFERYRGILKAIRKSVDSKSHLRLIGNKYREAIVKKNMKLNADMKVKEDLAEKRRQQASERARSLNGDSDTYLHYGPQENATKVSKPLQPLQPPPPLPPSTLASSACESQDLPSDESDGFSDFAGSLSDKDFDFHSIPALLERIDSTAMNEFEIGFPVDISKMSELGIDLLSQSPQHIQSLQGLVDDISKDGAQRAAWLSRYSSLMLLDRDEMLLRRRHHRKKRFDRMSRLKQQPHVSCGSGGGGGGAGGVVLVDEVADSRAPAVGASISKMRPPLFIMDHLLRCARKRKDAERGGRGPRARRQAGHHRRSVSKADRKLAPREGGDESGSDSDGDDSDGDNGDDSDDGDGGHQYITSFESSTPTGNHDSGTSGLSRSRYHSTNSHDSDHNISDDAVALKFREMFPKVASKWQKMTRKFGLTYEHGAHRRGPESSGSSSSSSSSSSDDYDEFDAEMAKVVAVGKYDKRKTHADSRKQGRDAAKRGGARGRGDEEEEVVGRDPIASIDDRHRDRLIRGEDNHLGDLRAGSMRSGVNNAVSEGVVEDDSSSRGRDRHHIGRRRSSSRGRGKDGSRSSSRGRGRGKDWNRSSGKGSNKCGSRSRRRSRGRSESSSNSRGRSSSNSRDRSSSRSPRYHRRDSRSHSHSHSRSGSPEVSKRIGDAGRSSRGRDADSWDSGRPDTNKRGRHGSRDRGDNRDNRDRRDARNRGDGFTTSTRGRERRDRSSWNSSSRSRGRSRSSSFSDGEPRKRARGYGDRRYSHSHSQHSDRSSEGEGIDRRRGGGGSRGKDVPVTSDVRTAITTTATSTSTRLSVPASTATATTTTGAAATATSLGSSSLRGSSGGGGTIGSASSFGSGGRGGGSATASGAGGGGPSALTADKLKAKMRKAFDRQIQNDKNLQCRR